MAGVVVRFDGLPEMKARLEAMSEEASLRVLQPIVERWARPVQQLAQQMAPYRKGILRAGIVLDFLKAGVGYCYFILTLTRKAYYGIFQEFGLGSGRSTGIQAKTGRRASTYANSMRIRTLLMAKGVTASDISKAYFHKDLGITFGLSRREIRRQQILSKGGYLQGKRRPNMAAHPFFRPAVKFSRGYFIEGVLADIWAAVASKEAPS